MRALSIANPFTIPFENIDILKNATNPAYVGCAVFIVVLAVLLLVLFKKQYMFIEVPDVPDISTNTTFMEDHPLDSDDKQPENMEEIKALAKENSSFVKYLIGLDNLKDVPCPDKCRTVDFWLDTRGPLRYPLCDDIFNDTVTPDP